MVSRTAVSELPSDRQCGSAPRRDEDAASPTIDVEIEDRSAAERGVSVE